MLTPQSAWTWIGAYQNGQFADDPTGNGGNRAANWIRVSDLYGPPANPLYDWTYLIPFVVTPPAGAPPAPGPVVTLAGSINGQSVGLWGPVWVDSDGVFYGTALGSNGASWVPLMGTTADGRQWSAALIQAMLAGTATAAAQAAVANASHGGITDLLSNPLWQVISLAYGIYSAYSYFGIDYAAQATAQANEYDALAQLSDNAAQASAAANEMDAVAQLSDAAAQATAQADEFAAQAQLADQAAQAANDVQVAQAAEVVAQQQAVAQAAVTAQAQQAAQQLAAQQAAQQLAAEQEQQLLQALAEQEQQAQNLQDAIDAANQATAQTQQAIDTAKQLAQAANNGIPPPSPPSIPDLSAPQPSYAGAGSAQADWFGPDDFATVTPENTLPYFDAAGNAYGTLAEAAAANLSYGLAADGSLLPADAAAAAAAAAGAGTAATGATAGTVAAGAAAAASGLPDWMNASNLIKAATAAATLARVIGTTGGQVLPAPGAINPATGLPYGIATSGINAQTLQSLLPFLLIGGVGYVALSGNGSKPRKASRKSKRRASAHHEGNEHV